MTTLIPTADRVERLSVRSLTAVPRAADWLARFEPEVPAFAHVLLSAVCAADDDPRHLHELRESAQALGVLRAQQGHAVAGLVEDFLALRPVVPHDVGQGDRVVDVALTLAAAAYVEELTAVLASKATRDPLTGLPNRAAFDEALLHEISATNRVAAPSLLLLDLDRFKLVNDTHGHLAGDAVLVAVADVLRASLRPSDVACRLGGDEFAVVLPRTSPKRAVQVAQRLLVASRKERRLASPGAHVTFSVGVGWLEQPAEAAQLVALADAALYAVKATGGDDVRSGHDVGTAGT